MRTNRNEYFLMKNQIAERFLRIRTIALLSCLFLIGCAQRNSITKLDLVTDWDSPGLSTLQVWFDEVQRTALIYLPTCLEKDTQLSLVLVFHGGGGTAEATIKETGWTDLAEKNCFIVVFPEGLPPDPQKPSSFLRNPQHWNDGSGRFNLAVDELGFITSVLDEITDHLPINPARIYATGFSNGASMTFQVGAEMESQFAAIAPVAGALWYDEVHLDEPVSLLYITGREDSLNPIEGGVPRFPFSRESRRWQKEKPAVQEHLRKWGESLNCHPSPLQKEELTGITEISYQNCRGNTSLVAYLIEDMGHTWPGGRSLLPRILVGKSSNKMDATEVIWDFFQDHPHP